MHDDNPSTRELSALWRGRAENLRRWAAADGAAKALEYAADELDAAFRGEDDEPLTLKEAAAESGYSADHLGRELSRGHIPNAGRTNAPRIRRGDLPRKRGALSDQRRPTHLNRAEIARAVVTRHAVGDE